MKMQLILLNGDFIDPENLPHPNSDDGGMNAIKSALLSNLKALVWSQKLQKWIYVLYDEKEVALAREQFPNVDCFTLIEMWHLSKSNFDAETFVKIAAAKRVFKAKISSITNTQKEP